MGTLLLERSLSRRRAGIGEMRFVAAYAAKRLVFLPLLMLIVVTISFAIVNVIPSDPANEIAGGLASNSRVEVIRHQLGLDTPLPSRYWSYITHLVRGDLGHSYYSGRPVTSEIWQYLPSTLELVILAMLFASLGGILLGALAAFWRNRLPDRTIRAGIAVAQSVPDFFLALLLIYFGFFLLRWAPTPVGQLDLLDLPPHKITGAVMLDSLLEGHWDLFRSAVSHAVLPVLALSAVYSAYFAKTAQAAMSRAFGSDQIEFARACGLPTRQLFAYAFRSARTPILAYAAILLSSLIGGAAIVETIFAWNGLGQWAITAIVKLDVPEIQGFILTAGLFTLVIFLLLDIVVVLLDPRISRG